MNGKKVIVGQNTWGIADDKMETVCREIHTAMSDGNVAELELVDADKRPVTVYVNCKIVEALVVDTDGGPRPSEWSG